VRKLEQQKIDESMDLEQSMQPVLLEVFSKYKILEFLKYNAMLISNQIFFK
jgi:hypothetical protein